MSYLTEAFRALDALNEETFSVSDDGIKKLAEFETDDDLLDEITVFDADAENTEDLEDSYVGKVIVDCNVCHSKIYKDKSDVVIDEETQNANIDEECPYCYSTDGFKVIGEVAPMTTETEEKVEVEDDIEESCIRKRMKNESFKFDYSQKVTEPFDWESDDQEILIKALSNLGFYAESDSRGGGEGTDHYYDIETDEEIWSEDLSEEYEELSNIWKKAIKQGKTYKELQKDVEQYYYDILSAVDRQLDESFKFDYSNSVNSLFNPNSDDIEIVIDALSDLGLYAESDSRGGNEGNVHYYTNEGDEVYAQSVKDEFSDIKNIWKNAVKQNKTYKDLRKDISNYFYDITEYAETNESLNEATVTDYKGSLSNVLVKNKDNISKMATKGEIVKFLDSITDEVRDKKYLETVKRNMQKKNDFGALQYIYGIILSGEGKGVKESLKENIGKDIDEYQQWVDYDMKRYHKISDKTNDEIRKAGLQVVKDKYGDYQVIAGKYDESVNEDLDRDLHIISDIIDNYKDITGYDIKDIFEKDSDKPVFNQDIVNETSDSIIEYVKDKYGIDITRQEDILYKLDDKLLDMKSKLLDESVKDVTITTDDSRTTMTSEDEGKVTVTTEPIEEHKDEDEVIEPLTDETEAEIEDNDGEEVDIEDFDEESFDELGEGYFKKVYENVNSFKTSNVSTKNNKVIVEGVVTFDNNTKKNTKFIFESVSKKNNKYRLIGENVNITKGNKAFSLMGSIKDKKFLSESLNYNYRTKNDIGKSTRCLGTIRRG